MIESSTTTAHLLTAIKKQNSCGWNGGTFGVFWCPGFYEWTETYKHSSLKMNFMGGVEGVHTFNIGLFANRRRFTTLVKVTRYAWSLFGANISWYSSNQVQRRLQLILYQKIKCLVCGVLLCNSHQALKEVAADPTWVQSTTTSRVNASQFNQGFLGSLVRIQPGVPG